MNAHKILIIDDDDMVREMLQEMFREMGHSVATATNGREGIAAWAGNRPDVVFTDLQMPEMDGLQVIATLRERDPDIPIIVISGAGTLTDAIEAVRLGAWDYVTKPVGIHQLEIVMGQASERIRLLAQNKAYQHYLEDLIMERTLKLRDTDIRFRTLFESANDAIILMLDDRIISCNNKTLQFFACAEQDIIGKTLLDFSPPLQPSGIASERMIRDHLTAAGEGDPQFYEWRHLRQDGQVFDAEISVNRLRLNGHYHLQAIMRDVTERKQAEEALRDNIRLKRELEIAQAIQQSLLPSCSPNTPGLDICCRCVPASEIGGDYYDFFSHDNGIIDAVIADVTGHGIGPALLMVEARSTLHARKGGSHSPGSLLAVINSLLHDDLSRAELQMSMFGTRFDMQRHTVSIANAGHVRPLLLHRDGSLDELDAEGMIMGIAKEVVYEDRTLPLVAGELFLFYTDGIVEAESTSEGFFGVHRLKKALLELYDRPVDAIVNGILDAVSRFSADNPFKDDRTVIAIRVA